MIIENAFDVSRYFYASVMGAFRYALPKKKGILEFPPMTCAIGRMTAIAPPTTTPTAAATRIATPSSGNAALLGKDYLEANLQPRHSPTPPFFLAPPGRRFDDAAACELASADHLLFICSHYEGIDERAYTLTDQVISLGDYVLTSGELAPAWWSSTRWCASFPACWAPKRARGTKASPTACWNTPVYAPADFNGMEVPPVLAVGQPRRCGRVAPPAKLGAHWRAAPRPA